jgi:hypothetical protein
MKDKISEILNTNIPNFSTQVELKIPQINKIELPKLKKIE